MPAAPGLPPAAAQADRAEHAASRAARRAVAAHAARLAAKVAPRPQRPRAKPARSVERTTARRAATRKPAVSRAAPRSVVHKRVTRQARAAPARGFAGRAVRVIAYARTQLGRPYSYGNLDCSGLTKRAFAKVGIRLPHKASGQDEHGRWVRRSEARAGDLVFWGGDSAYHVGIYLGGGRVIHAPKPGDRVKVSRLWGSPTFARVLA